MKKVVSIVLVLLLGISVLPSSINLTTSAATKRKSGIYTYTVSKGKATIVDCKSSVKGALKIPSKISGYRVTSIGREAFLGCTKLTKITIPNGVKKIGSWAFENCTRLNEITISKGVKKIGDGAFYDCQKLTEITIPGSVTSIGSYAFWDCTGLTKITIQNGVKKIDYEAFLGCKKLTKITIPGSVTSIGSYAFKNCTGLSKITIPNGVKKIGKYAFLGCKKLTKITIPNGVTSIDSRTFKNCTGLTKITIPRSVTSIGSYAFENCKKLTKITIPGSVTSIGSYAFKNCTRLSKITILKGVKKIGKLAFLDCKKLNKITIPGSVTSIGTPYWPGFVNIRYGGTMNEWESLFSNNQYSMDGFSGEIECSDGVLSHSNDSDFEEDSSPEEPTEDVSITLKENHTKTDKCSFKMTYRTDKNEIGSYSVTVSLTIINKKSYQINTSSCFPILRDDSNSYGSAYASFVFVPKGGEQTVKINYERVPAGKYTLNIDSVDIV